MSRLCKTQPPGFYRRDPKFTKAVYPKVRILLRVRHQRFHSEASEKQQAQHHQRSHLAAFETQQAALLSQTLYQNPAPVGAASVCSAERLLS